MQSGSADAAHSCTQRHQRLRVIAGPKEELGTATWTFLHTLAAQYPERPTKRQRNDTSSLVRTSQRCLWLSAARQSESVSFRHAPSLTGLRSVIAALQIKSMSRMYPCADCAADFEAFVKCAILRCVHTGLVDVAHLLIVTAGVTGEGVSLSPNHFICQPAAISLILLAEAIHRRQRRSRNSSSGCARSTTGSIASSGSRTSTVSLCAVAGSQWTVTSTALASSPAGSSLIGARAVVRSPASRRWPAALFPRSRCSVPSAR